MSTTHNDIILFFLERHIVIREEWQDMICKFLTDNNINLDDTNCVSNYVNEQWLYSDVEQWLYLNENMKPSTNNIRLTTTRSPLILQPGEYHHYKKFLQYLEWLDEIVDSRIANVLKNKPDSFWQPIHDYQQVNSEVTDALAELNGLRKDFALVSETIAYNIGVIKDAVMKKQQKMKMLKNLYAVNSVRKAYLKAQMLINDKQYADAIIFIREKQKEIKTTYKHVTSLRCQFKRLNDLKETVGKVMLTEFAELIQQEFSANRDYVEDFLQYENELTPVILGLFELKEYKFIQVIYMEIAEAVIGIIRRVLKEMTINFGIDLRKFDPNLKNLPELLSAFKTSDWLATLTLVSNCLNGFRTRLLRFLEHLVILSGAGEDKVYESSLPKDSNDDSGIDFSEYTLNSTLQSESFNLPSDTLIKDMTSQKSLRKLEVEKKKEKLAALRAEKAKQEEERRLSALQPIHNTSTRHTATKEELDLLLESVGIVNDKEKTPVKSKAKPPLETSMEDCENGFDNVFVKPLSPAVAKVKSEIKAEKMAEHANPHLIPHALFQPLHKKEINRYSKAVQTDVIEDDVVADGFNNDISALNLVEPSKEEVVPDKETEVLKILTEEDKLKIMSLPAFQVFFYNASKIIEKHLEIKRENEAFTNYTQTVVENKSFELLTFVRAYKDTKQIINRSVASMEFCSQYKELVAVAYGPNKEEPHEFRGVVCIWNTKFEQQPPEFLFYCNYQLSYITFCPTNRHLLYGGCNSGQIVMWDSKIIDRKLPMHHSPISGQSHACSIVNIHFTGAKGNQDMHTISSDGKICVWDAFGNLSLPNYCNDFQCRPNDKNVRSLPTTAACFNADGDCFVIGSEDGLVFEYLVDNIDMSRKAKSIEKTDEIPKIDSTLGYKEGKETPVSAVHFHVATGAIDFSHLFLISTIDWTIHMYSRQEPLWHLRFDVHQAPVTDVKWSPIHPAVFASVDLSGTLCLWNLNENVDDPVLTVQIEGGTFNKLAWSLDGKNICVGDCNGTVSLYACGESLYNVKNITFYKLTRRLTEVKQEAEMREAEAKTENEIKEIKSNIAFNSLQDLLQK